MPRSEREAIKVATERLKQAEIDPSCILSGTALAETLSERFTEDELKKFVAYLRSGKA